MVPPDDLFSDEDLFHFITRGFHVLNLDDIPDTHTALCRETEAALEHGNPADAIWEKVPTLRRVFTHPSVCGALTSLLGPGYQMYAHRHCHFNPPRSEGGDYHQDGTERLFKGWTRPWRRHFRPRTVMAIYYPQDTPPELGPTAIIPGSQYLSTLTATDREREMLLTGGAGTLALVPFHIWHRATANHSDRNRIMMKFLFKRTAEPKRPSWNAHKWFIPEFSDEQASSLPLVWEDLWRWYTGNRWPISESYVEMDDLITQLVDGLASPSETDAINTAYTLGRLGNVAIPALIDALDSGPEPVKERVPFALCASGEAAVESLIHALLHPDPWIRASAADTLGDIGLAALEAVPAVVDALDDNAPWVRHNAAETLGIWGADAASAWTDLVAALHDEEAFVRFNAATALTRIDLKSTISLPDFQSLLEDEHPMVRHHARELAGT